ncbi:hypothetical protein DIC82_05595 [Clostridium beijerinckii]|nr:hypothetical protein DIC82_05595 [Clostridium beijerinckii]
MCIEFNEYDGIDNHHLKCKYCGRFMRHKGKIEEPDTNCDNYECECGAVAQVSNMDSEHDVFWSK